MLSGHMRSYLDFEKPVAELEAKVEELRAMGETGVSIGDDPNLGIRAKVTVSPA